MASTYWIRRWWSDYRCEVGENVELYGKTVKLRSQAHDAGRALEAALKANGYTTVEVLGSHRWCPAGISGRTCQPSGSWCSLHNYSLALDFDPFRYGNPHLYRRFTSSDWSRTKFTPAQVNAGEAIRTNNGKQVWRWLGWAIGDTMHWQINCSPADLATGIDQSTVPNYPRKEDDAMLPLKHGDGYPDTPRAHKHEDVRYLQNLLRRAGWNGTIDGKYGDETTAGVAPHVTDSDGSIVTGWGLDNIQAVAFASPNADETARDIANQANQKASKALSLLSKIKSVLS